MLFYPARYRKYLLAIYLGLLVVFSGCQNKVGPDYESLGLAEVAGTIRLDGKPLANAHVIFESPDQTYSTGRTDAGGGYVLMFNSEKSGVMTGEKVVRIQLGRFPEDAEEGPKPPKGAAELPSRYNLESQLKAAVVAGIQTIDFDLESDGPEN